MKPWILPACAALASPFWPQTARALCGDGVLNTGEECDPGNLAAAGACSAECLVACSEVGAAATDHTCGHGAFGPFATVPAFPYPGLVFGNVSAPHTYFTVSLSGDPDSNRSATGFSPNLNESYALYMKEAYPLVLRRADGEAVPLRAEHAISSCEVADSLTWVRVYAPLTAFAEYVVDIGPWHEATVSFAFESLGAFREEYALDADGDGEPNSEASARSGCVPPAPYGPRGGDCDDGDPSIHSGAPEFCDGVDSDCDGDEDGAEAGLCSGAAAGSACLVGEEIPFCGCASDLDCDEDRRCDASSRSCLEAPGAGGAGSAEGGFGGEAQREPGRSGAGGRPGLSDAGPAEAGAAGDAGVESGAEPSAGFSAGRAGDGGCACAIEGSVSRTPALLEIIFLLLAACARRVRAGARARMAPFRRKSAVDP